MHSRRSFLSTLIFSIASMPFAGVISSCSRYDSDSGTSSTSLLSNIGPLLPPNQHGLMLPWGFKSRIIAYSGMQPYPGSSYTWHDAPDGGATFTTDDGGWLYVSNSEVANNLGGAGAIRFDSAGNIVQAYSILSNTNMNCAGGPTPWGTWLSCEEAETGRVWECDPYGQIMPVVYPALGIFAHEAITVDSRENILYMTEDKPDGRLYRFVPTALTPEGYPDLSSGTVQLAAIDSSSSTVSWITVPDPAAISQPTRYQLASATVFNGGEGIVYYDGVVSFATKGDNRIWSYNTATGKISIIYDASTHPNPILAGVDNITLSRDGELVICEDGGDLQVVAMSNNKLVALAQLVGHDNSEITGPAFSPDGKRLYFSSQRGTTGTAGGGITFEVSGPFHK